MMSERVSPVFCAPNEGNRPIFFCVCVCVFLVIFCGVELTANMISKKNNHQNPQPKINPQGSGLVFFSAARYVDENCGDQVSGYLGSMKG